MIDNPRRNSANLKSPNFFEGRSRTR